MNATVTIQPAVKVNHTVTVLLTSLAVLTVLVDICYITVCFKALKKTFHHLMILGLFFSDSVLGISSALFSLGPVIKHKFIESCLIQISVVAFGLQLNYCLIFLLCLQRYCVVKSFNFGTNVKFEENKFKHIGVAIFLSFIITSFGMILTPKAKHLQVCTAPLVFGDSFYIYVTIIFVPITVIIIVISIMSIFTSFCLWKIYFKGTIAPIQRVKEDINISDCMEPSSSKTHQCFQIPYSNSSGSTIQKEEKENGIELLDIEFQIVSSNIEGNEDTSEIQKSCKMNSSQNCNVLKCPHCTNFPRTNNRKHSYISTDGNKISSNQVNKTKQKTVQGKSESSSAQKNDVTHEKNSNEMIDLKHYRNRTAFTTSIDDGLSFHARRQLKKSWEIRAFLTTIIIAFQTIALTGPFVASFWIEAFSNEPLTQQFRLLLLIPYLMNSISNPFIYAWRIPVIRQEFKKLFRIND